MHLDTLTQDQRSEQLLLDFGLGWLIQKIEAHHRHIPEDSVEKTMIEYFKEELPVVRRDLCWIDTSTEFQRRVAHFRETIRVVDILLQQSKALIIARRDAAKLTPVWPEELEWA